jgi:hypothetical protein
LTPVFDSVEGVWKQSWVKVPYTEDELASGLLGASNRVKLVRDEVLLKSDSLVVSDKWDDYDVTLKTELKTYRQSLRDLPEQVDFPYAVVWPVSPILITV